MEPPARNRSNGDSISDPPADVVRRIVEALRSVRYGSVEIVIQDARVVQIERREKFRFERFNKDER